MDAPEWKPMTDWSGLPDVYVTKAECQQGMFWRIEACSVPMAIGPEVRLIREDRVVAMAAQGAPERIWADEDTWFSGPGKTRRAKEYVRADLVAALIREAEARGMERAAKIAAESAADAKEDPGTGWASHSWLMTVCRILQAEAAAIRKDEETPK